MECYLLKRYVNCVSPRRKNTNPLRIDDIFAPSSNKHHVMWSSFEFQQKTDTVWNYQVKRIKLQTVWHRFFNSFIVTNWSVCESKLLALAKVPTPWSVYVSKLIALAKVPTPIRSSSLLVCFSWSSRTIVDIYSDNVWESRQCVILHLHLTKWLESTAINLISIFASFTRVFGLSSRSPTSGPHIQPSTLGLPKILN